VKPTIIRIGFFGQSAVCARACSGARVIAVAAALAAITAKVARRFIIFMSVSSR
jgi:hypothetical protein